MPFGIQPIHLIIVLIAALIIFGPSRLPELGRGLGRAMTEFRKGTKEMVEGFSDEIKGPASQEAPENNIITQPKLENGIYCTQCGLQNPPGARYCSKCGSQLAG